jgi:hypothetical protein
MFSGRLQGVYEDGAAIHGDEDADDAHTGGVEFIGGDSGSVSLLRSPLVTAR